MRLLVCVKTVARLTDEVWPVDDGLGMVSDLLEAAVNEWDVAAAEEALRLRDELGGEVVVVTCADSGVDADKTLRRCLAMGADRGIRVQGAGDDPLSVARALADVVRAEEPALVFCGVQSADAAQSATGGMIAALAGLPCAAVLSRIQYDHASRVALVDRELEGGVVARMEVDTPAVLTVQTGINQPRYANLRAIKQAERADVDVRSAAVEAVPAYVVRRLFAPSVERAEFIDGDAAAVARRLAEIVKERLV